MKSNVNYRFDKDVCMGVLPNGLVFLIDAEIYPKVQNIKWYVSTQGGRPYVVDEDRNKIDSYVICRALNYEVDHINLNTLDNRKKNLRLCTHQQNQINQPLQRNNTSGVTGVSHYAPRGKFRARIKVSQKDIHLGYLDTFEDAVKARNIAMKCMFGQYGRYNEVNDIPVDLETDVINRCSKYKELSYNSAFFDFWDEDYE
ncbi:HNH endonuclease [Facklamia sp. P12950]|uniref:HNH endonuclease n=1 Tax=Facklamia sp. P12950 TaxID=3421951 RepID=UPI003D17FF53